MENLVGINMGVWSEDGDTAFEPAVQTLGNEAVFMEKQVQEMADTVEIEASPAFENEGESDSFAGGNEPDDMRKESESDADEKASETTGDTAGEVEEQEEAEEAAKRAEHEAAEAQRKAEWEAKQQEKKATELEELKHLESMSDEDVMMKSMKRISEDTERLTRRNLKDCISEYIQTKCLEDPVFARLTLHPQKSMVHCFWYVNRMAGKFIEQEVKDMYKNPKAGYYGSDVPDGLCYQWAEEYFYDKDAPEDKEEGKEDRFIPKPYKGKSKSKNKSTKNAGKKQVVKKMEGNKSVTAQGSNISDSSAPIQFSLFELNGEEKAV